MLCAAHPKCKLTDSLCQECIFIFLLCFQPLSLFPLPVAVDHSESTVLKWILAEWSPDRAFPRPVTHIQLIKQSHFVPSRPLSRGPFTQMDHSLQVYSNRAEPIWYQGGLAIHFHEHWFLHFRAIFVSLSALVFNFPADILPFHKRNTKP